MAIDIAWDYLQLFALKDLAWEKPLRITCVEQTQQDDSNCRGVSAYWRKE